MVFFLRMSRFWVAGLVIGLLLGLAVPGVAVSAGTVVSRDPAAIQVDVLNGVVVWAAGGRIYVRRAGVTRRTGRLLHWDAPEEFVGARADQLDLGIDDGGRVVASFNACAKGCPPQVLDIDTMHVRGLRIPVPHGCSLGSAALWRARTLYALWCVRGTTRIEVREHGRSRRVGPGHVGTDQTGRPLRWPARNTEWPPVRRLDLRGRIAVAFVESGEVWLLDAEKTCGRYLHGDYNDGQVPAGFRTLAPHLSGNLLTWARNNIHLDPATHLDQLDGSTLAIARVSAGCHVALAPGVPGPTPRMPWPDKDWFQNINFGAFDILQSTGHEATSAAVDGHRIYVTLRGAGLVTQPFRP